MEISQTKIKTNIIEKKTNLDMGSFEIKVTIKIGILANNIVKEEKIL